MMDTENTHEKYQQEIAELKGAVEALTARVRVCEDELPRLDAHLESIGGHGARLDALEAARGDWRDRVRALEESLCLDDRGPLALDSLSARIKALEVQSKQHNKRLGGLDAARWPLPGSGEKWSTYRERLLVLNEAMKDDALVTQWKMGTAKPENTPPTIPVEDLVTAWAGRVMLDALEAQGADEDARTSIMEEMVGEEALRDCLGDAVLGWAKELVSEYEPPAKPDKERIAEVAGKVTAKPSLDDDAVKTLQADEIARRMECHPLYGELRDHWHCVAQAGLDAARKGYVTEIILVDMFNAAADRAAFAKRTPSMRGFNPSGERMQECLGYVMEMVSPPTEAEATQTLDDDCGPPAKPFPSPFQPDSPRVKKMADEVLPGKPPPNKGAPGFVIDPEKAAKAVREPPLGERSRPIDIALHMAQSLAEHTEDPHPLEVANWMVVCERGLKAHLTGQKHGHGIDVVEIEMRAALRERQELNPGIRRWEPDELAFSRAVGAIPIRAKQVKE